MNQHNIKLEKINHLILKHLNLIIKTNFNHNQNLKIISFREVKINNNYSRALVYYTFLSNFNEDVRLKNTIKKALMKNTKTLRFFLAQKLTLYKTPQLKFIYDDGIEQGNKIEKIISKIHKK